MSDRFSAVAARAQTLDGFAQTLGPVSLADRFKVQQSIADGIVYITQDGGPWLPIATGAGASATLASAYANGPAGNTIPMTDALGQVSFSSAITTGSIVGIVTTNAPATLTAAVTGLKIDMRSVGTAATPSTFDVPAILVEGAYSSVAKAAGSALVAIRSGYRNATALSVRVRNKQAAAGSIAVFGWDTTNYEGAVAPSIITGDTHVVTIDASTNVTPGDKSMTGLRVVMPAGTGTIRGIDITSTQTASNLLEINANGSSATVSGAYITMASGVTNASRGVVVDWLSDGGALVGCIMVGSSAGITLSGRHIGAYLNMQTSVTAGSQAVYGGYALMPASSSVSTTGFYVDTRSTAGRFFAGEFSVITAPSGTFVGCEIDCQTLLTGNGEAVIGARYRITNSSNTSTAGVIVDGTFTGSGSAGVRVTLTPSSGNASGVTVSMGANISKTGITDGSAFLATLTGANTCGLCVAATYNAGALAQNGVQMRREMTSSASFTESTTFLETVNTSTFTGGTQTFSQSLALFGNYATISGATHTWSGNLLLLTNAMTRSSGTGTLSGTHLKVSHVPTGTFTDTTTGIAVNMTPATSSAVVGQTITMASNTSSSGSAWNAVWNSAAGTNGVTNNAIANIYTNASMNSATLTFLSISSRTANLTISATTTCINIDGLTNISGSSSFAWQGISMITPSSCSTSSFNIKANYRSGVGTTVGNIYATCGSGGFSTNQYTGVFSEIPAGAVVGSGAVYAFRSFITSSNFQATNTSVNGFYHSRSGALSNSSLTTTVYGLYVNNTPTGPGSGTAVENGSLAYLVHAPISGVGGITDTTTGLTITMTPASSSAVSGVVVTMAANASATSVPLAVNYQSLAGSTNGVLRVAYDVNGTTTGALTLVKADMKTASVTLGAALTGVVVDLATNVASAATQTVQGLTVTLGGGATTATDPGNSSYCALFDYRSKGGTTSGNGIVQIKRGVAATPDPGSFTVGLAVNMQANYSSPAGAGLGAVKTYVGTTSNTSSYSVSCDTRQLAGTVITCFYSFSTSISGTVKGLNMDLSNNLTGNGQQVQGLNVYVGNNTATVGANTSYCATFDYRNPAGTVSGNGIVNIKVGAATTLTGALTGLECGLSTNVTAGAQTVTGGNITMPSGTGIIRGLSVTTTGNSSDSANSAGIYISSGFARNGACALRVDCAPTSGQTTSGPKALLIQTTNNNWVDGNFCEITNSSTGVNAAWNLMQMKVNPAGMSANAQMRTLWSQYSPTFTSGTYTIGTLNNAIVATPTWNSAGTGTLSTTVALVQLAPTRSAGTLNVTSSIVLQADYTPSGTIGTDNTVVFYCKMTPASAATGACIEAVMANANAGGAAIKITHSGTNANQLVFASAADGTGAHIYGPTTAQFNIFAGTAAQASGTTAGRDLVLQASSAVAGSSSAGAAAGGSVYIRAKDAARLTSGNANGGDVSINPGAGIGTGVAGGFLVGSTNATFMELYSMTAPAVGAASTGRLFVVDNGAGKMQLAVQFPSGAAQVLATEP